MFESVFDYVDRDEFTKYIRLLIIVSCYILFRKYYTKYASLKLIKRQLEQDKKEKEEKPARDSAERQALHDKLAAEAETIGWGKKTRKNVQVHQLILEAQAAELRERHQTAYDAAEDNDIEDLLED